jgi:hypothetical protein
MNSPGLVFKTAFAGIARNRGAMKSDKRCHTLKK